MAKKENKTCWNTAQAMRLAACLSTKFWKFTERMGNKLIFLMVKENKKLSLLRNCMRQNQA